MQFIQTWQRFFPVSFFFFKNFQFTYYKNVTSGYPKVHRPTHFIVISTDDLAPNRPHIRIWYGILTWINQLITIDLILLAIIWRQQDIILFLIFRLFFSDIARSMFIYHRHTFVSYIIHQNNPVSKPLHCISPWFLRNRSYRRRAPSYRRHPINYRRHLFRTNLPTVVSRRIFRG